MNHVEIDMHVAEASPEKGNLAVALREKDRCIELLTRAVNNRTRERNYFQLHCRFLEGELSGEDFEREIDANQDEYVVSNDEDLREGDVEIALGLIGNIKDVDSADDMADLFSFDNRNGLLGTNAE